MKDFSKVIILYGQPGSGKGTIAFLISKNFNFIHFDTGFYIKKFILSGAEKGLEKERENFKQGRLYTPSWTLEIVKKRIKELIKAKVGLIFSGSPRTFFEAFGREAEKAAQGGEANSAGAQKTKGLIEFLQEFYGKENIYIFELKVKDNTSIKRNSARMICPVCGQPRLSVQRGLRSPKNCAFCGSKLIKRVLDNKETIKIRLKEYYKRTAPMFKELEKRGFKVIKINGENMPFKVYQEILKKIK